MSNKEKYGNNSNLKKATRAARKQNKITRETNDEMRQPKQPAISSVPARIVEHDRKTSLHIIDTLAKTALAIGGSENAAEKLAVIKEMWAMQKEAEDRQAEREFNVAKVVVAQNLPQIPMSGLREFVDKNNVKQSSKYSTLDDIEGVLDPLCRDHGLVKEYSCKTNDKGWACQVLTVRHVGGYKEVYESPYMPLDTSGAKNNQQGAGSVAKYGRRYALIGAFNVFHVDNDDDGAGGKISAGKQGDPFAERVKMETKGGSGGPGAAQAATPHEKLLAAADLLIGHMQAAPTKERRGELMMSNTKLMKGLEDAGLLDTADAIRALAEQEVVNAEQ